MTEADTTVGESPPQAEKPVRSPRTRADFALSAAIAAVLVALLALSGVFGYQVYREKQRQELANPAMRVVRTLVEQARQHPDDPLVRARLGEALATAGKYDEAIEQLQAAVTIKPDYVGAYQTMGTVFRVAGDINQAERAFLKVLELTEETGYTEINQRREIAYFQLGDINLERQDYEEAVANFKAALRIRPDASDTYVLLALAFEGLEEPEAAKENLVTALRFDPNFPQAHYELGKLLLAEEDFPSAAEEFRKAADLAPDVPEPAEALDSLGPFDRRMDEAAAAESEGDFKAALDAARIALALDPASIEAGMLRARMHEKIGESDRALEVYKVLLEENPDNAEAKAAVERLTKAAEGKS